MDLREFCRHEDCLELVTSMHTDGLCPRHAAAAAAWQPPAPQEGK